MLLYSLYSFTYIVLLAYNIVLLTYIDLLVRILPLFFKLLKCQDKELRKKLQDIIISDLTKINKAHKNNVYNYNTTHKYKYL